MLEKPASQRKKRKPGSLEWGVGAWVGKVTHGVGHGAVADKAKVAQNVSVELAVVEVRHERVPEALPVIYRVRLVRPKRPQHAAPPLPHPLAEPRQDGRHRVAGGVDRPAPKVHLQPPVLVEGQAVEGFGDPLLPASGVKISHQVGLLLDGDKIQPSILPRKLAFVRNERPKVHLGLSLVPPRRSRRLWILPSPGEALLHVALRGR